MKVGAQDRMYVLHSRSLCGRFFLRRNLHLFTFRWIHLAVAHFQTSEVVSLLTFFICIALYHMLAQIFIVMTSDQLLIFFFFFPQMVRSKTPEDSGTVCCACVCVSLSQKMSILVGSNVKSLLYLLCGRMLCFVLGLVSGLFPERTVFVTAPASYGCCSADRFTHSVILTTCSVCTHWSLFASAVEWLVTPALCCLIAV